jgi:hypothetical protein
MQVAHLPELTPHTQIRAVFWLVPLARFRAPKPSRFRQNTPVPLPRPARRSGQFGTLQGATGGTQTHSRRTGSRLGRLHCARQGLVRDSESSTKYGGNSGKTGVARRPVFRQVSVSPHGFPSEKIIPRAVKSSFVPLFTGQLFILPEGLHRRDSRKPTEVFGLACRSVDGLTPREPPR